MRKKFGKNTWIIVLIIVLGVTIGYSFLSSHLSVMGSAHVATVWNIYYDNIEITDGSVSTGVEDVSIDSVDSQKLVFHVPFTSIGDFYEFRFDVVNGGTINGMIDEVIINEGLAALPEYLEVDVSYDDNTSILPNQLLEKGTRERILVRVSVKDSYSSGTLQNTPIPFSIEVSYRVANQSAIEVFRPYLYNILKKEVGGLSLEYSGEHKDSFTKEATEKIYFWNGANATSVLSKRNVIFANHCWQLLRTTDTGGVKLIYNGPSENNQCLSNRGTHVGFNQTGYTSANPSLDVEYYYATDYYYDAENSVFALAGDKEKIVWSDSTYQLALGKYTCLSTDENGTCANVYYVFQYKTSTTAQLLQIKNNVAYPGIANTYYQRETKYINNVGYMYDPAVTYTKQSKKTSEKKEVFSSLGSMSSKSYYYSTGVNYNEATGKYELINLDESNVQKYLWKTYYSTLKGYYTCASTTATTCNSVYYVTYPTSSIMYYVPFTGGQLYEDVNKNVYYADSYSNGQLDNPSSFQLFDWVDNISVIKKHYICSDFTQTTCSDYAYISTTNVYSYGFYSSTNIEKFAHSFTYNNGLYTLTGEIKDIWNYDVEDFSNVHYTCQNGTTSCESIAFITKVNVTTALVSSSYDYYLMTDGKGMQDVLRESLYDDEVNKQDSIVKRVVDLWYQRYLSTYDSYLEDVIYCGDRYISDFKSYSDTGALSSIGLSFDASKNNYDGLDCKLETDQFSVSNPKAHLNYPIGLSTYPEMVLLNSNTLRAAGYTFWTMTPDRFQDSATEGVVEVRGGFNATSHTNSLEYVRPVIALKAGIKYTDGEGSEENPYIVG